MFRTILFWERFHFESSLWLYPYLCQSFWLFKWFIHHTEPISIVFGCGKLAFRMVIFDYQFQLNDFSTETFNFVRTLVYLRRCLISIFWIFYAYLHSKCIEALFIFASVEKYPTFKMLSTDMKNVCDNKMWLFAFEMYADKYETKKKLHSTSETPSEKWFSFQAHHLFRSFICQLVLNIKFGASEFSIWKYKWYGPSNSNNFKSNRWKFREIDTFSLWHYMNIKLKIFNQTVFARSETPSVEMYR